MSEEKKEVLTRSLLSLKSEAEIDTRIDKNKLDKFALELSGTLSKWSTYMVEEKMYYESKSIEYAVMKKKKYEYYRYDYQYVIEPRGGEMDIYINADIDLLAIAQKMTVSKQKMLFIENIMKTLTGAGFNVKNIIDWNKFMAGGF